MRYFRFFILTVLFVTALCATASAQGTGYVFGINDGSIRAASMGYAGVAAVNDFAQFTPNYENPATIALYPLHTFYLNVPVTLASQNSRISETGTATETDTASGLVAQPTLTASFAAINHGGELAKRLGFEVELGYFRNTMSWSKAKESETQQGFLPRFGVAWAVNDLFAFGGRINYLASPQVTYSASGQKSQTITAPGLVTGELGLLFLPSPNHRIGVAFDSGGSVKKDVPQSSSGDDDDSTADVSSGNDYVPSTVYAYLARVFKLGYSYTSGGAHPLIISVDLRYQDALTIDDNTLLNHNLGLNFGVEDDLGPVIIRAGLFGSYDMDNPQDNAQTSGGGLSFGLGIPAGPMTIDVGGNYPVFYSVEKGPDGYMNELLTKSPTFGASLGGHF